MAKIIGIVSGKDGVGKTTTTANLGVALQIMGNNVCIVDANVITPNLGLHFGITNYPVTVHEILKENFPVLESLFIHHSGLRILPGSLSLESTKDVNMTRLRNILETLAQTYDFVLVDCAPGLEKQAIEIAKSCNELFIVTNLDLPSVTDTIKIIEFARENKIPVDGLIVNKVLNKNFELKAVDVEIVTGVPIITMIPFDINVLRAISAKIPIVLFSPHSPAAFAYKQLAAKLSGATAKKKGVFDWFRAFLERSDEKEKIEYKKSSEDFKEELKREIIRKLQERAREEITE